MEIGPVTGVRPIAMVKPIAPDQDLSGIFAIEFRRQENDESYSPSHQRASRGLEDEEAENEPLTQDVEQQPAEERVVSFAPSGYGRVSFFA